jgi:choline kinase
MGVGYLAGQIEQALAVFATDSRVELVHNPGYERGSIVTLWMLRQSMVRGGDILLMDADTLFDSRLLECLTQTKYENCLLLDRDPGANGESVKLCVRDGLPAELRKNIDPGEHYDLVGEMAGLVKLSTDCARRLADASQSYIDRGRLDEEYEEALRDVVLGDPERFGIEECTGLPWIEIDFPDDVQRARQDVLPRLYDDCKSGEERCNCA